MIPSFLVHYTPLSHRLESSIKALQIVSNNIKVVTHCDGNCVSSFLDYTDYDRGWNERIMLIKHILIANTLSPLDPLRETLYLNNFAEDLPAPSWLCSRKLTMGEQSVLLKHYFSLCSIANGADSFGLVCEDDVIGHDQTFSFFEEILGFLSSHNGHYCDLAGGCGLEPSSTEIELTGSTFLAKLIIPRTRTNASYIISKHLASYLVSNFFPAFFPIDWHLQYLYTLSQINECYWSIRKPFIHGSEEGFYSSWRK